MCSKLIERPCAVSGHLNEPPSTFTACNPVHPARMLKDAGGIPAHQDPRAERDAGCRFDVASPDYR